MRTFLRRPSPAMIVACLALLVALGGTSVAAVSQLAKNSVGTPQLKNNAVTAPKIRNASVTNPKIANNAINRRRCRTARSPASTSHRASFPPARPGRKARRARRAGRAAWAQQAPSRRSPSARRRSAIAGRDRRRRLLRHCRGHGSVLVGRALRLGRHWLERQRREPRALDRSSDARSERDQPGGRLAWGGWKRQRAVEHVHRLRALLHPRHVATHTSARRRSRHVTPPRLSSSGCSRVRSLMPSSASSRAASR